MTKCNQSHFTPRIVAHQQYEASALHVTPQSTAADFETCRWSTEHRTITHNGGCRGMGGSSTDAL